MFKFYANKNQLTVRQREPVTSGSANVYRARFEFSDDWDGLTRKAVFNGSGAQVPVLLDETGECDIPWEALAKHGGQLYAGVYGTAGETTLPTIYASLGTILEGVTADGEASKPPTPELWEQELARKGDGLEYDGLNLTLLSGNKPLSTVRIAGGEEGGAPDFPTIKNVRVDNISCFGSIDLPCYIHFVNSILGYTFQDDIVYVSADDAVLTAVTIDNATVTMSIDPETGSLDVLRAWRLETRLEGIESGIEQLRQTGGNPGEDGTAFTPSVSEDGILSWTNDGGLENPEPVDIRGPKGKPGQDGFSPVVTVSEIDGGHRVTITDSDGPKTFDVLDGVAGIEEYDTADGWHVRKWSNGYCELSKIISHKLTKETLYNGMYYYEPVFNFAPPSFLKTIYSANVQVLTKTGDYAFVWLRSYAVHDYEWQAMSKDPNTNKTVTVSAYFTGVWK